MRLDLHVHTVASDGAWTAEQVVQSAVQGRLDILAVADHDTTAAVGPAQEAARGLNLQVIPAAELSSTHGERELHILGYFLDESAPELVEYQVRAQGLRHSRMEGMVEKLQRAGVEILMEEVLEEAGPDRSVLARPHLAKALVRRGHVGSVNEAFERFIGDRHDAFIPTRLQNPSEAIEVIEKSGGLAVWAHPPADLVDGLVDSMVRSGLQGLEVYRPGTSAGFAERLLALCRVRDLVVTGGSDWHDPQRNDPLGKFFVTSDEISDFLELGGI